VAIRSTGGRQPSNPLVDMPALRERGPDEMQEDSIMAGSGSDSGSDFGSDDSSESAFDSDGGPVYELFCAGCTALVTRRGSRVRLIADAAAEMYSTDLVTAGMEDRGRVRAHEACECEIRDIFCACCRRVLGYHVLEPCLGCSEGGNNGHYYMFVPGNVLGQRRALPSIAPDWSTQWARWDSIGAFEARDVRRSIDRVVFISSEEEVQECTCPVCLDILEQPVTLPCGHTFCRVCASRAVDLQRCWCVGTHFLLAAVSLKLLTAASRGRRSDRGHGL
jgi:hypothetical protein